MVACDISVEQYMRDCEERRLSMRPFHLECSGIIIALA